jgi:hypothetical protein
MGADHRKGLANLVLSKLFVMFVMIAPVGAVATPLFTGLL